MSKRLYGLWILLIVQLLLVLLVYWPRQEGIVTGKPLLALTPASVTHIVLSQGQGGSHDLALVKKDRNWQLPEAGNFPVDSGRVEQLLNQLAGLKTSLPVAVTEEAAKRFHVGAKDFANRIRLQVGGRTLTLYVGDAAGANLVYVRVGHDKPIYSLALPSWLLSTDVAAWRDKRLLSLDADHISRLALPNLTLVHKAKAWQLADGKTPLDQGKARELVELLANISFLDVTGTRSKVDLPRGGFDVEAVTDGKTLDYHLVEQPAKDKSVAVWYLTRSDQPFVFTVSADLAERLQTVSVDALKAPPVKASKTAGK